jgi:hypothetical protein
MLLHLRTLVVHLSIEHFRYCVKEFENVSNIWGLFVFTISKSMIQK